MEPISFAEQLRKKAEEKKQLAFEHFTKHVADNVRAKAEQSANNGFFKCEETDYPIPEVILSPFCSKIDRAKLVETIIASIKNNLTSCNFLMLEIGFRYNPSISLNSAITVSCGW